MQWHFSNFAYARACVFCICGSFYETAYIIGCMALVVGWLVNDELEGFWSDPSWTKKRTIQEFA
jgi:hypothetical protein